jgi:hypothetical protein
VISGEEERMNHKFRRPRNQRGGCWCKYWKKTPGMSRRWRLKASEQRRSQDDVREDVLPDVGGGDGEGEVDA